MAKRYVETLAAWVQVRELPARNRNLAAFLSVRADVMSALEAGFPITTIWANLRAEGRIAISYETFRRYMKDAVRAAQAVAARPEPAAVAPVAPEPSKSEPATPVPAAPSSMREAWAGFRHNPNPNAKDLF